MRAGRTELTKRDIYAGVDRFTQGELRPALPTSSSRLPLLCFAAREVRACGLESVSCTSVSVAGVTCTWHVM